MPTIAEIKMQRQETITRPFRVSSQDIRLGVPKIYFQPLVIYLNQPAIFRRYFLRLAIFV